MSGADAPRPWTATMTSRAAEGSGPWTSTGCPRCGSMFTLRFYRYARSITLAAGADRLSRNLRDASHVDADRGQDLPRADAAHQPLLEHRVPGHAARRRDAVDALWRRRVHDHVRSDRASMPRAVLGRPHLLARAAAAVGRRLLSPADADAARDGRRRAHLDDAGRGAEPD